MRFPAPFPGELLPPVMTMTRARGAEILACTPLEIIALEPLMMSRAAESLALRGRCYGGRGGGFLKARVCSRSSHESKIRKLVIDAKWLKNGRRGPIFSLAARQSSSAISQVV